MKKWLCFLMLMAALWLGGGAGAEETTFRIGGGVTFLVSHAAFDGSLVQITVEQRPDDSYTALMDNQTEYPQDNGSPDIVREKEEAGLYGRQILGTLCDLWSIDGEGLPTEYSVSCRRKGAGLVDTFTFELPDAYAGEEVCVTLVLGVNEDLSSRFSNLQQVEITVPRRALLPESTANPDDLAGDEIRVLTGQP